MLNIIRNYKKGKRALRLLSFLTYNDLEYLVKLKCIHPIHCGKGDICPHCAISVVAICILKEFFFYSNDRIKRLKT